MTERERFLATMRYQPVDRGLLYDFSFWVETLPEWHQQGLPEEVSRPNAAEWFGLDWSIGSGGPDLHNGGGAIGLRPGFPTEVLEDRGDHEVVQQGDGVRVLRKKYMGSIPHPESHLLTDRASWEEHYKPRLDPDDPGRVPANLDALVARTTDPERTYPMTLGGGSLYGWIRNWMGMENVTYLVYDDPKLFAEMVERIADVVVTVHRKLFEAGCRFEAVSMWEDMCYNAGPLLSPEFFIKYMVPHYKRITDQARQYGVEVVWVDCDGKIDDLIPHWLAGGVNCMFPIEVGVWGADPYVYRQQYGRDLLLMGAVSKRVLASSQSAIHVEVLRLAPLVEEGGFIPMPDHRVPPDVPFENYLYYCRLIREVWGRGLDLPPMKLADRAAAL